MSLAQVIVVAVYVRLEPQCSATPMLPRLQGERTRDIAARKEHGAACPALAPRGRCKRSATEGIVVKGQIGFSCQTTPALLGYLAYSL